VWPGFPQSTTAYKSRKRDPVIEFHRSAFIAIVTKYIILTQWEKSATVKNNSQ